MRRSRRVAAVLAGMVVVALAGLSHGADETAEQAVERVGRLFHGKSSVATLKMDIVNSEETRSLAMTMWSLGEKVRIRIDGPREEAGTVILKLGSAVWCYLPKSKSTVKVPLSMSAGSWMGSDFTIDDLVKESALGRDYTSAVSFEGKRGEVAVREYTLTPKPNAPVVWGKIVLQIRQADRAPTWQGYYDEDGRLLRELIFSDHKAMGGRVIPTRMTMRATQNPGAQTTIEYQDVAFEVPVDEATFSLPESE